MRANTNKILNFNKNSIPIAIFILVLALVMLIFSLVSPVFMTTTNFGFALKAMFNTAVVALGLTFVVVVGQSDMSFHFVSCFGGMTMAFFIGKVGLPPLPSIILGMVGGLIFGLICGLAVGVFNLPDMIVTIGIGSAAWGMAYLYSNGDYIYQNFLTSGISQLSNGRLSGIPYPVIYMFVVYILAYILLHQTKFGRRFYATGSNRTAAAFSGIKVERYVILAFVICAVLASFTFEVMTAAQGNGNVKGGLVLLMPAWASVFVGISIFKKPTVIGTFLGAFLIAIMQNGFTLMNAPFYVMDLITGISLIVSILVSRIQIRRRHSQALFPTQDLEPN
jgi:ribose transport system permease protein